MSPAAAAPTHARTLAVLIGVEALCLLGAEISRFGVSIWVYGASGAVREFGLLVFAGSVPGLLVAPLAGSVVDRVARKAVLIGAAVIAVLGTLVVLTGALAEHLSMPMIMMGAALASVGEAFAWPALAATVPNMATAEQLPRFNGLLEAARAMSQFAGPVLGGVLIGAWHLSGLLSLEIGVVVVCVLIIAALRIPSAAAVVGNGAGELAADAAPGLAALCRDTLVGWQWIWAHKPMLWFLGIAVYANIFLNIGIVLMPPYGLAQLDAKAFGIANGLFGAGMIVGGLLYGLAGKYARNLTMFFASALSMGALYTAYGFARTSWALGINNFLTAMMMAVSNGAILTIWQRRIPAAQAGRVLSAVRMVAYGSGPLCYLLAGPLADVLLPYVFNLPGPIAGLLNTVWGAGKIGQLGCLFSLMGLCLVTGFALSSRASFLADVEPATASPMEVRGG